MMESMDALPMTYFWNFFYQKLCKTNFIFFHKTAYFWWVSFQNFLKVSISEG